METKNNTSLLEKLSSIHKDELNKKNAAFKMRFQNFNLIAILIQAGYSSSVIWNILKKHFPNDYHQDDESSFKSFCLNHKRKILAENFSDEEKAKMLLGISLPDEKRILTDRQKKFQQFKQWDNVIKDVMNECAQSGKKYSDRIIAELIIREFLNDESEEFKKTAMPKIMRRVKDIRMEMSGKQNKNKNKKIKNDYFDFNTAVFLVDFKKMIDDGLKPKAIINQLKIAYPNAALPTAGQISNFKARMKMKKKPMPKDEAAETPKTQQPVHTIASNEHKHEIVQQQQPVQQQPVKNTSTQTESVQNKWANKGQILSSIK